MNARDEILRRIRAGVKDVRRGAPVDVPWRYGQPTPMVDVVGRFVERVEDYKARVERVATPDDVPAMVVTVLADAGVTSVVVPTGVEDTWRQAVAAAGMRVVVDDPPVGKAELNEIGAVVTTASVGVAETGTLVLSHGPGQGRRVLTLLPDVHACVIRADDVVSDVPEAIARLRPAIDERRPLTWISGGSATSDIELARVEGVHGPRTLLVIVVG
ncbi:MAG: LUD domain-containing protein [Propionibacteriaceae bacterium]|nr:LUD domain-containing protein [Propionibacteriaceae bacterium]